MRVPIRLGKDGPSTRPYERRASYWTARIRFVNEATLEDAGSGLAPVTEGWFVVNVGDAEWFSSETRGAACWFANEYGQPPIEFAQLGINVTVLEPGQSGVYHAEANQEAFLILLQRPTAAVWRRRHPIRSRSMQRPRGSGGSGRRIGHACPGARAVRSSRQGSFRIAGPVEGALE